MTLHVGLMLPTAVSVGDGRDAARLALDGARCAEGVGFDGVYVGDHLLHPHPILESVVTLSAVAASTERVALGSLVLLAALRQPLVLAKQLGTLAVFAPGRVRIGLGVGGEYPGEFEAAGVPLADRGERLESTLAELRTLLADGVGHPQLRFEPRSALPFVFGGRSDAALRRAARAGDGWIGYLLTPDGFAARKALLVGLGAASGFRTGMVLPVHVADGGRAVAAEAGAAAWSRLTAVRIPDRYLLAGSVDDVVEQALRYVDRGCDEIILAPADQGGGYLEQVALLGREVVPRLQTAGAS